MTRLDQLAEQFNEQLKNNPSDAGSRVNQFLLSLQQGGIETALWDETAWSDALRKLGVPEEELYDQLENVAGWGVIDDGAWMAPDEKAVWDKLFAPGA